MKSTSKMYINLYKEKIDNEEIIVSERVAYEVNRLMELQEQDNIIVDPDEIHRFIKFAETHFTWSDGTPMKLALFQKVFLESIYSYKIKFQKTYQRSDGTFYTKEVIEDHFREVYLEMGRKMGKTELIALINIFEMLKCKTKDATFFCASENTEQAKLLINAFNSIISSSSKHKNKFKLKISYPGKVLYKPKNILLQLMPNKYSRYQGIKSECITIDEIHLMKEDPTDDAKNSQKSKINPKIFYITTAGILRNGLYDEMAQKHKDDMKEKNLFSRTLVFKYTLDNINEMNDSNAWAKALPNLGITYSKEEVEADIIEAQRNPKKKIKLITTIFGIPMNSGIAYFKLEHAETKEIPKEIFAPDNYIMVGADLSNSRDISAIPLMNYRDGIYYTKLLAFIPQNSWEHLTQDKRDDYRKLVDEGWLIETPSKYIEYDELADYVISIIDEMELYPRGVAFDRWKSTDFMTKMKNRYGRSIGIEIAQGAKTLALPFEQMYKDIDNGKIVFDNPLMADAILNVITKADTNGNLIPDKRHNSQKIDAFAAMLNAYTAMRDVGLTKHGDAFY